MAHLGSLPTGWVASVDTVQSGGLNRDYLVLRPATLSAASHLPVVFLLAGREMTPDQMLRASGLAPALASTGPAVLVVPAGWHESWDAGDCCSAAYTSDVNDVAFIQAVVNSVLASTPAADPSALYAVGFSNGGRMAYRLACAMPGTWRGFVAVEAVPVEPCSAMAPVGVTVVAQQNDPLLTVSSGLPKHVQGFAEPTVVATVAHLASLDHCARSSTDNVGVSVEQTSSCAGGRDLRYVWYPGGGHNWRAPVAGTPGTTDYVLQMMGRGPLADIRAHGDA